VAIDDIISAGQKNRRDGGGSRRSASRALAFWTMAIIAGAGAAVSLKWYVDKHQAALPTVSGLVVAAIDLPLATTLKEEHLAVVDWPSKSRPAASFGTVKELVGRVLIARSVQGEPILASKLAAKESGSGLAALIPENMRALAVRVDDVVGVAGFIHPEDHVDVLVTMHANDREPTAKVILQNVKVLAVGRDVDVEAKNRGKALPVTVATLLVTPEQSEKLALATVQGKLLLTLRSFTDSAEVLTAGVEPAGLIGEIARRPQAPAEAAKPRTADHRRAPPKDDKVVQAPAPASTHVEILRGDRFEERKFDSKEK
jgi:pilus assembly protein CpaB